MTSFPYPRVIAAEPVAPAAPAVADSTRTATRPARPAWERAALAGLLVGTAVLYIWGLGASGWANAFYSAAAQAASQSWKAFFFGSFDASNAITVDKPPAALWVMGLSARIFGVNAWSLLVPQALEGVATVALLYAAVRRRFGAPAGLLAGAVAALTPVAVLMFRFDNPDALLVLLLVGAAYALTRALEGASTRWLVLVGALVGFAFLAKMLQAFLVVPGFALVYLLAAPASVRRRIVQLLVAGAAMIAAGGWWVAIVELWPASSRPYIGGSQTNSVLELMFGYNGLGRLNGNETGSAVAGGQGQGGQWGSTGLFRLFETEMGGQASWLIPAALLLTGYLLWMARRAPRTDGRRAQVLLWASWLVVTGLVFSFAQGIIHPYYTVALAPAIGALVGMGVGTAWRYAHRADTQLVARVVLAATTVVTGVWAAVLLARSPEWLPWLRPLVLVASVAAAVGMLLPLVTPVVGSRQRGARALGLPVAGVALAAGLAGPVAYSLDTAATPHTGALPSAGPVVSGFGPGGRFGGPGGAGLAQPFQGAPGGTTGTAPGGAAGPQAFGGGRAGGLGGLLDASTPDSALVDLLKQDTTSTWAAAAIGSNSAAGVQLASGRPVMAIGGFNGSDPSPTLAQFQADVAAGKIHYFLGSGGGGLGARGGFGGPGGGSGTASEIASWVAQNFTSTRVGGVTVYDLTQPASGSTGGNA
jgi:4-amino-4-deoxy-L-arabinose transferase-like glycosyltransferase